MINPNPFQSRPTQPRSYLPMAPDSPAALMQQTRTVVPVFGLSHTVTPNRNAYYNPTTPVPLFLHSPEQTVTFNDRPFRPSSTKKQLKYSPACKQNQLGDRKPQDQARQAVVKARLLENRVAGLHHEQQRQMLALTEEQNAGLRRDLEAMRALLEGSQCGRLLSEQVVMCVECQNMQKQNQDLKSKISELQQKLSQLQQSKSEFNHILQQFYGESALEQPPLDQPSIAQATSTIAQLHRQLELANDTVASQQQSIQVLKQQLEQSEEMIAQLRSQGNQLQQKIQFLEFELHQLQADPRPKLEIKFAESESINFQTLHEGKLNNVPIGHSLVINQLTEHSNSTKQPRQLNPDHGNTEEVSIGSLKSNTMKRASSAVESYELDQKYLNSFKVLELNNRASDGGADRSSHLAHINDRMAMQNNELNEKLAQLIWKNQELSASLQVANDVIHRKQVELENVREQVGLLRQNTEKQQGSHKNLSRSRIDQDRLFQLKLSNSFMPQQFAKKQCEKCTQLINVLLSFGASAKELDMTNSIVIGENL